MPAADVAEVLDTCSRTGSWSVGMCGQFCAAMYGYGFSGYASAYVQWQQTPTRLRNPGDGSPPPGALLFWSGGSAGHGHVAVSTGGDGQCYSIDISGPGTVSRVQASLIQARWGLTYLGWAYPFFQGKEWTPAMIYGIDVSAYQSTTVPGTTPGDGKRVDYCWIKATQGTSYVNPRMAAQAASARAQGMVVGFYHFLEKGNVAAQAQYFVDHAASQAGDPLAIDWETNPVTKTFPTNADKDAAIKTVQGLRPGHRVLLYCNTSFWKGLDTTSFAGDGLWIATAGYDAGKPPVQSPWLLHQYSTAGGIDHDVAQFSSREAMRAWAAGTGDGADVALSDADKTWIKGQLTATSLVDGKAHGFGYYLAHGEQNLAAVLAQAKANGEALTKVQTVLAALDLSQVPAEVAAKIEQLKLVVSVTDGGQA